MATNPMQRKARNSFLAGFFIAVLIAAVVIGILLLQYSKTKQKEKQEQQLMKYAYVLLTDVKSGEEVKVANLEYKQISTNVTIDNVATVADFQVQSTTGEIKDKKIISKIDLPAGTILTKSMIQENDEKTTSDLRTEEYNMISLPTYLEVGEYIDIRLLMPSGENYIVVSKKKVLDVTENTVWLNLTEDEILTMSNAIVESYIATASNLYATKYVEPGIQDTATPTYQVSAEVLKLMNENPNIQATAKQALASRYKDAIRQNINASLSEYEADGTENLEQKMQEQREKAQEQREKFLAGVVE